MLDGMSDKDPALQEASDEVKKRQTPGFTEVEYLGALKKATKRLDQELSEPDQASPRKSDRGRRDD